MEITDIDRAVYLFDKYVDEERPSPLRSYPAEKLPHRSFRVLVEETTAEMRKKGWVPESDEKVHMNESLEAMLADFKENGDPPFTQIVTQLEIIEKTAQGKEKSPYITAHRTLLIAKLKTSKSVYDVLERVKKDVAKTFRNQADITEALDGHQKYLWNLALDGQKLSYNFYNTYVKPIAVSKDPDALKMGFANHIKAKQLEQALKDGQKITEPNAKEFILSKEVRQLIERRNRMVRSRMVYPVNPHRNGEMEGDIILKRFRGKNERVKTVSTRYIERQAKRVKDVKKELAARGLLIPSKGKKRERE